MIAEIARGLVEQRAAMRLFQRRVRVFAFAGAFEEIAAIDFLAIEIAGLA